MKEPYTDARLPEEDESVPAKMCAGIAPTETVDESDANRTLLPAFKVGHHVGQEDRHSSPDTSPAKCDKCVAVVRENERKVVFNPPDTYRTEATLTVAQMMNEMAERMVAAMIWYAF